MSLEKYNKIANNIKIENKSFINGNFVNSKSNNFFEAINPATREILTEVVECDDQDVDYAVQCARKAFESGVWSKASPEYRKDILLKLANLLRENSEEISVLESIDSGKTITDCLNEVGQEVPNHFQWYGELIDKIFGKVVPTGIEASSFIIKEPIGVVGLVVPWNFPLINGSMESCTFIGSRLFCNFETS